MSAPLADVSDDWIGMDPATRRRTFYADPAWYPAGDVERAVVFQPGYRTDRQSFGVHGMDIKWLLRGPRGVTQFVIYTHWVPGAVGGYPRPRARLDAPMGADLGYHALCPQYEGAEAMGECEYLGGRLCFYDGSGLAAEELLADFVTHGEGRIWQALAQRHDELLVPQAVTP